MLGMRMSARLWRLVLFFTLLKTASSFDKN